MLEVSTPAAERGADGSTLMPCCGRPTLILLLGRCSKCGVDAVWDRCTEGILAEYVLPAPSRSRAATRRTKP